VGGDDAPAQGLVLLDDLVDLVGSPGGAIPGHADYSVGDDDVARVDDDAADGNRSPVRPGPLLSGPAGAGSASEDDQPLGREGLGVADGAVDDPTKDALVNPDLADQVPEVTLAVDDEDVADLAAGTLTNRSRRSWGARSEGSAR